MTIYSRPIGLQIEYFGACIPKFILKNVNTYFNINDN